jgi:hypothetical protein
MLERPAPIAGGQAFYASSRIRFEESAYWWNVTGPFTALQRRVIASSFGLRRP